MWVDVVTAVHSAYAEFLPAADASLRSQTHARWRWLVQVDGPTADSVRTALAVSGASSDPRVVVDCSGTFVGPAVARNQALARSDAHWVQNLDADDQLEPGAVEALASAVCEHPSAGFAVGRARDLLPDGRLVEHDLPVRPGPQPRGALPAAWLDRPADDGRYRLPVHPAGVLWHRLLVVHLGGWSALFGMEDTGLLMAASAAAEGVVVDTPTLRYRKHPRQLSASAQRADFDGGRDHISLVRQRVEQLRCAPAWLPPGRAEL